MKATSGPSSMAPSPMGNFVHTPLKRKDGSVVIVNRGWVPRTKGLGETFALVGGPLNVMHSLILCGGV